jgi:hypothetical protein
MEGYYFPSYTTFEICPPTLLSYVLWKRQKNLAPNTSTNLHVIIIVVSLTNALILNYFDYLFEIKKLLQIFYCYGQRTKNCLIFIQIVDNMAKYLNH